MQWLQSDCKLKDSKMLNKRAMIGKMIKKMIGDDN